MAERRTGGSVASEDGPAAEEEVSGSASEREEEWVPRRGPCLAVGCAIRDPGEEIPHEGAASAIDHNHWEHPS